MLRDGAARIELALLDIRGVDRRWMLTGLGTPVRVDAGLEWEHRTITPDPAARSVRLPAGGIDVVVHDSRLAGLADLDAVLGGGLAVAAVVFVDDHRVDVVDPATARAWAAGERNGDPVRRRLTRVLFNLAAAAIIAEIDVRTVYCGSDVWDLLAGEAAPGDVVALCCDDPALLRGRYPLLAKLGPADVA